MSRRGRRRAGLRRVTKTMLDVAYRRGNLTYTDFDLLLIAPPTPPPIAAARATRTRTIHGQTSFIRDEVFPCFSDGTSSSRNICTSSSTVLSSPAGAASSVEPYRSRVSSSPFER